MTLATPPERPTPARVRGTRLRDGRRLFWWVEVVAALAFYLVYSGIRNSVNSDPDRAFDNARRLMDWQARLGINVEETLQDWALDWRPLIVAMNYFYGSLHFVVTAGVVVYLYRRWPDDYPLWRNTLAISTALALIGFFSWPLMPPRLLPGSYGFVDTLARFPTFWSFDSGAVSKISNQYAAMPSVHCAWALFCTCALVPRLRATWARVLAVAYPVLTVTVIVLTGNHYFLDAVGGFLILGVGYLLARAFTRAGRGEPRPGDAPGDAPGAAPDGARHPEPADV